MFCVQEKEIQMNGGYNKNAKDPLDSVGQSETDDEDEIDPPAKKPKLYNPEINLKIFQLPNYNLPKSLTIYPAPPTSTTSLPKFVNNPLNLANPLNLGSSLTITASNGPDYKKYMLPNKVPIPVLTQKNWFTSPTTIRYKKNGEVAKKRGPPKGYKRKPKNDTSLNGSKESLTDSQPSTPVKPLKVLSAPSSSPLVKPQTVVLPVTEVPRVKVPPGVELVELELDPEDWFPSEPYKMSFSRKKNPKWKSFPYRCEHCFKGYRVMSTLLQHAAARHGCAPKAVALACPCCPHVAAGRKQHKKHLETHHGRKHRIFCPYCVPPADPTEKTHVKESEKYPFDEFPQYWYASEESLRLHKKRKHPYAAMYNYNWYCSWGDGLANS